MTKDTAPLQALIVENDATGRELLARVLRLHGCVADTVIGARAAAAVLAAPGPRYDLLVADVKIDWADGLDLLRGVAAMMPLRRPRQIVVISDQPGDYSKRLADLGLELELFQKPVHLPSLVKVLEKLRDGAP